MRTRIEIDEGDREKLLAMAAERGERSCGRIVQEAVAFYLQHKEQPPAVVKVEPPIVIEVPRAETRAERVRLVVEWLREEAVGFLVLARTLRGRIRRQAAPAA